MTNEELFKLALDHVIRRQGLPPDDAPPEQVEAFADEVRKAMATIKAVREAATREPAPVLDVAAWQLPKP